ncbi:hypothetical protein [Sorangium cellulosum]|uniref:Uncharacterized protein n=1 Tax=Sorangium cellulosum TaxID=56 RepID=A0A150QGJ2_SORCE|nr:hypothetical protein [Sorangium cellulosum]KYF66856.1 hypothetical protein BE15_39145 [Sorangium cellulosum]
MNSAAVETFARALATMAAEIAADLLEQRMRAPNAPRYATPKENPLGSARAFREAAAAGAFKTFRRGKQTAALWADVEAWMMSRPPPAPRAKPQASGDLSLRDELALAARPPARKKRSPT